MSFACFRYQTRVLLILASSGHHWRRRRSRADPLHYLGRPTPARLLRVAVQLAAVLCVARPGEQGPGNSE